MIPPTKKGAITCKINRRTKKQYYTYTARVNNTNITTLMNTFQHCAHHYYK